MERRKAITAAAAASLTLLAGAAGIALNSGIVGATGDDNVGQISPVDTTAKPPIAVYVDDPASRTVTSTPPVRPTDSQPVTTSAASGYQDDDHDEHEDEDDDDRYEHESEDDDHDEYEGAEDDD
jgi:hypothetical protein